MQTLEELNYGEPTSVQAKSIPLLLAKKDLLVTSQTGTGKTAAFVLPMLENLKEPNEPKRGEERYMIQSLILAPTRELVIQINHKIAEYGKNFAHTSVALYGGIKLGSQVSAIRAGANIAVGTTSRVLEHIKNGTLNLSRVEMIVLDEADKMLEMGFLEEIRQIIAQIPKSRHAVMFSATFPKPLVALAKTFLDNPITIEIDKENLSAKEVKQLVHYVDEAQKMALLCEMITQNRWEQVLIFANTKFQVDKIVEHLKALNLKAAAIHGDKSQGMRMEALKNFKSKKISLLVATDVAARGIDIMHLPYVINFELPLKQEDYIHRIGRTGRAGQKGIALSLVCEREKAQLQAIEALMHKKLAIIETKGFSLSSKKSVTSEALNLKAKKKDTTMKKAKALAEKMMKKEGMGIKGTEKKKKRGLQKPRNKRHF